MKNIFSCLIIIILASSQISWAQDVLNQVNETPVSAPSAPQLAQEKIDRISGSKRVFIITNNGQSFSKGDFISLITENELTARAIVAKTIGSRAGIKILKIYSLDRWKRLGRGSDIQVLKGDDSYYINLALKSKQPEGVTPLITGEDDLYNDTLLEEDLTLEEKTNRKIKTDNIIGLSAGQVSGVDENGGDTNYFQLNGSWMYQFADNIWGEAMYGQSTLKDFPGPGLNTTFSIVTLRLKYTFEAPFDAYIQPYAGYQIRNADSPNAGQQSDTNPLPDEDLAQEKATVDELGKDKIAFGVTILKRLVPGWFIRADLGTDYITGGLSLEF